MISRPIARIWALDSSCKHDVFSSDQPRTGLIFKSRCLPEACKGTVYTVEAGDSCIDIAQSQNITVTALQKANEIPADCKNLQVGQDLYARPHP